MLVDVDARALRAHFAPERPGPMLLPHVVSSGVGRCRADRWPDPRVALVELPGGNVALRGDPAALDPAELADLAGLVEAPPAWLPVLRRADPGTATWPRIVSVPSDGAPDAAPRPDLRRLGPADGPALAALDPSIAWIHETWGGPQRLAGAGVAWAVFAGGAAVSVAVPFYVGERHEDIGVVTDPGHRGRGLSTACAAALIGDIRARGRRPTWTTSPANTASRAVAARLGFVRQREDVLYAVRVPLPD